MNPIDKTYLCGHGWTFVVVPPALCPLCYPCIHGNKCSECKEKEES